MDNNFAWNVCTIFKLSDLTDIDLIDLILNYNYNYYSLFSTTKRV